MCLNYLLLEQVECFFRLSHLTSITSHPVGNISSGKAMDASCILSSKPVELFGERISRITCRELENQVGSLEKDSHRLFSFFAWTLQQGHTGICILRDKDTNQLFGVVS